MWSRVRQLESTCLLRRVGFEAQRNAVVVDKHWVGQDCAARVSQQLTSARSIPYLLEHNLTITPQEAILMMTTIFADTFYGFWRSNLGQLSSLLYSQSMEENFQKNCVHWINRAVSNTCRLIEVEKKHAQVIIMHLQSKSRPSSVEWQHERWQHRRSRFAFDFFVWAHRLTSTRSWQITVARHTEVVIIEMHSSLTYYCHYPSQFTTKKPIKSNCPTNWGAEWSLSVSSEEP